jgi:hypothetical protein
LARSDVPDQPTLRFIRDSFTKGIDADHFTLRYLNTCDNLTGPLNKFVQFAGLLPLAIALQVCDVILAWTAKPGSRNIWPKPADFDRAMMGDVSFIIRQSLQGLQARIDIETMEQDSETNTAEVCAWLRAKADQFGISAWHMCDTLLKHMPENRRGSVPKHVMTELHVLLAEKVRDECSRSGMANALPTWLGRSAFQELLDVLRVHPKFSEFYPNLFAKSLKEATDDRTHRLKGHLVMILVDWRHPAFSEDPPADSWTFEVRKDVLQKNYDMSVLLPALTAWSSVTLPDPVAQKAFEAIKREFQLK